MPRRESDADVLERPEATALPNIAAQPKVIFGLGRGARGKTVSFRWMVDRALKAGRAVTVADGDRTNQTLAAFFDGVRSPPSAEDADMRPWLDGLLEKHIEARRSLVVDLGGGDQLLKGAALELDLAAFLPTAGLVPVGLHFLGADKDDVAYLADVERDGLFAPAHTAIVFNEGVVPAGVSVEDAWRKHREHPAVQAAVTRGAKLVRMPRLGCMTLLDDRRLRFSDAGPAQVGLMNAQRVVMWLREVEQAFGPILDWLP